MTSAISQRHGGYLERPAPSSLADVVELILDKGLVIDAYVRVSLVGIELLTIDARIVVASVDTYLRFAEATNRLDLYEKGGKDLTELTDNLREGGARSKTRGALGGVKDKVSELVGGGEDEDEGADAEGEYEDDEYEDDDEDYEGEDEDEDEDDEDDEAEAAPQRRARGGSRR